MLRQYAAEFFAKPGFDPGSGAVSLEQKVEVVRKLNAYESPEGQAAQTIEESIDELKRGVATPLKITFQPAEPIFPLQISGLGQGKTWIEVYVLGLQIAQDQNKTLAYDAAKPLDAAALPALGGLPGAVEGALVTRLTYKGLLEGLEKDAIFDPMGKAK